MSFIFLILLAPFLGAVEIQENPVGYHHKKDNISEKYQAGAHLIFDCEENHWVCVLPEFSIKCENERRKSIEQGIKNLSCAFIGEFPTKFACFQRVLYLTGHAHGNRFCLLDELKREEIRF